ncbi:MAG: glycosyltransferase family 2 protein [Campylobacterota bacterium]
MNSYPELLSFTIPTYNRSDFLEECLDAHIPVARKYNLEFIVLDNASTDDTPIIVQKKQAEYPHIRYYRNETTIDPDSNFKKALELSTTKYTWLLGDSYRLPDAGIEFLLPLLSSEEKKFDAIVFNLISSRRNKSQIYTDANLMFKDLGAIMTSISSLIFSKKLIQNADFERYKDTNFLQTGIIFDYIAKHPFRIKWIQEYSVESLNYQKKKKIAWSNQPVVFEIACKRWQNFIFSLPDVYSEESKLKVIRDFGALSGIFSFRNLLNLRKKKILTYDIYLKYQPYFQRATTFPESIVKIIAFLPIPVILVIRFLAKVYAKSGQFEKYWKRFKNRFS